MGQDWGKLRQAERAVSRQRPWCPGLWVLQWSLPHPPLPRTHRAQRAGRGGWVTTPRLVSSLSAQTPHSPQLPVGPTPPSSPSPHFPLHPCMCWASGPVTSSPSIQATAEQGRRPGVPLEATVKGQKLGGAVPRPSPPQGRLLLGCPLSRGSQEWGVGGERDISSRASKRFPWGKRLPLDVFTLTLRLMFPL